MIVINLVLFIGLMLLARDLQSLVSNGFNDFCVHRSVKGEGKEANCTVLCCLFAIYRLGAKFS